MTLENGRKSSHSNPDGNCVEVGQSPPRTSSYSMSNGDCVEVGADVGLVQVADTKQHGHGPVLAFNGVVWGKFVTRVTMGSTPV